MATTVCASCGQPIPTGARFCPNCGFATSGVMTAPEERRIVTVLFADLVGYTTLAENRDPEQVKRLIEACFERLVADIEEFGGRVDKLLGDGIVALFGAPVAHEDDAERAVRAGLRMQRTLGRFASEREDGARIEMRVGINTGEVLVGTLAGSDYTAMGDVVNTAARLQALAPPGGVLIGSATAALCSSSIDMEPFGITQIRGRDRVEESSLVIGALAAGARPVRWDVPFVGRAPERSLLDAAVQLVRNGHSGVVSIIGEPGAGKTRLAEEIVDALEAEAIVVRTACAPYGEQDVWAPVVTGLTGLFGLERDATAETVRLTMERRAQEVWGLKLGDPELERFLDVGFFLLGHPSEFDRLDAAGARDRLAAVVTEMLRRNAQTRMTVLWVDNLQWADPMLRDHLAVIVRSLSDCPFLLITGQRPDPDVQWPPTVERPLVVQVPLGPLERADCLELVRSMLATREQGGHDDAGVEALVDRGGGNPLFLVELAALAASCPDAAELPGTLRALIAARVDQLPGVQRAILDNAAVLGHHEHVAALARFAEEMGQDFRVTDLDDLACTGMIELEGKRWQFRSDVVREVVYQTLTKRVRAQRHAGVAAVMAAGGYSVDDVAQHAATAAELLVELGPVDGVKPSIIGHAIDALLEAAKSAVETGRYDTADRLASRGLDLHRADPATERKLLLVRATAELERRRFGDAIADAEAVLESALADGDRVNEGQARRRLGTIAQMQGDLVTSRDQLEAAIEIFREIGDRRRLADSLRARGFAEAFGGSLPVGRAHLDEAMEIYHDIDDERGHAWAHQNLAWVAFQGGDFNEAEVQLAEAQQRFQELGDHTGVSWAAGLQAWVSYFQRRFDEAEELALAVESDARRWGDPWATLMMQTLLANLRLWTGRLADAEQFAERALAGFREVNDRYGVMQALGPLNRARAGLGKKADAKRGVEESIALGDTFGELGLALQAAAGVAMHLGQGELAVTLAEQVLERAATSGMSPDEGYVLLTLGRCQIGDADGALEAIDHVDVEDFPFGRSARALARAIGGDHDGAIEDAEQVEQERGASYFDLSVARLAGVIACDRAGNVRGSRRWLDSLTSLASSVGDVVFVAVAQRLHERPVSETASEPSTLAAGWRRVVDAVVVG